MNNAQKRNERNRRDFSCFVARVHERMETSSFANYDLTEERESIKDPEITGIVLTPKGEYDAFYHTDLIALAEAMGIECYITSRNNEWLVRFYWSKMDEQKED